MVSVPKMVCFFEAAFENGLRFPLHPFIKSVLQHFNVCPSQLSPNFWGVLVGLLAFFRDKGLGVPSIALLLDLFSVKEALEGFLYISKRAITRPIISDLPSSLKHWKECYFFVGGQHWEYNPADQDDTLGISIVWAAPENLREFSVHASRGQFFRGQVLFFYFVMVVLPSGICPDLTPEDREVKRRLGKCRRRAYSNLIKSDLPGS